MENIKRVLKGIGPLDRKVMESARQRQDRLTKPQKSLGVLEDLSVRVAGIMGDPLPEISDKAIIIMIGDHGVAEEGVSAYPREVTGQMVYNFVEGGAGINVCAT
ncbi:MAG: nicotinate-nucleotide--dimethylbenzimidazole phosphoribosyltransferase, partial [Theionarchaea archaeon]|nr:nicotinate-nucleotide--dimethylbenzimidazole phosphoribosyltransferase [Theionarchaea archaeon]